MRVRIRVLTRINARVRARARALTATDGDDGLRREVTAGLEGGGVDPRHEVDDYPFSSSLGDACLKSNNLQGSDGGDGVYSRRMTVRRRCLARENVVVL
jgi:hypothetical protein